MTNIYSDDRHVYSVIPARRYGLASDSDAPSVRRPVVDKERTRPGR